MKGRGIETERDKYSICRFIFPDGYKGPGLKLGTRNSVRFLTRVTGTQALEPSSAALAESWARGKIRGIRTSICDRMWAS